MVTQDNKLQHRQQLNRVYLFIYYYILFCQGIYSNSLGTLIPYLSEASHLPETAYSFLFMARTVGSLIGVAVYRYIHNTNHKALEHKVLIVSGLIYLVFMITFVEWESQVGQWISMSLTGGAYYCTITAVNICILLIVASKQGAQIMVGYGLFGVGALLAPQLIRIFEQEAYFYISFFYLGISIFCLIFPMPIQKQNQQNPKKQLRVASSKVELLFVLAFFLIVGMELTTTGWIPSYAVLNGACNKEEAAGYGTIYYMLVVVLRLGIPRVPTSSTNKIKFMLVSMVLSSLICLVYQHYEMYEQVAMFGSIGFGVTVSAMYPLALVVAGEYGIGFQASQTANMMTASVLSSGLLTGLAGILMGQDIRFLIYSFFVISSGKLITFASIFKALKQQFKPGSAIEKELIEIQTGVK